MPQICYIIYIERRKEKVHIVCRYSMYIYTLLPARGINKFDFFRKICYNIYVKRNRK